MGDVDYFYLHETPNLVYRVDANPAPADSSTAEFHSRTPDGSVLHNDSSLKREGSGQFPFDIKGKRVELKDSPIFVVFTFKKGALERKSVVVISLADPAVRSIWAPPEAYPGESVKLEVIAWDAKAYDEPDVATQLEERTPTRIIKDVRDKVRWLLEGQELAEKGESIQTTKIAEEHLGKWVTVVGFLGEAPVDPNASRVAAPRSSNRLTRSRLRRSAVAPASAQIAVPRLKIVGEKKVIFERQIELQAVIEPAIAGTYSWTGGTNRVALGEGPTVSVRGVKVSEQEDDIPIQCAFTSEATRRVYRAEHKLTVVEASEQAAVLQEASQEGAAFCEECEKKELAEEPPEPAPKAEALQEAAQSGSAVCEECEAEAAEHESESAIETSA